MGLCIRCAACHSPWQRNENRLRVFAYPHFKLFLARFRINLDAELSTVSGHDGEFDHVPHSQAA
jgi:hypothetical protein